eukprot:scaffold45402_cov51-Phaeocystis_antarctica.AAC.2
MWWVFELYRGACIITSSHGVRSRSTADRSASSQSYCSEPNPVAAYEQSVARWTGPTFRLHHKLLSEPLLRYGIG